MMGCWACGHAVSVTGRIGRTESCPACHHDLHCCKGCAFYVPSAYNECREPVAERVLDKEAANFCDYFSPGVPQPTVTAAADSLRRKLQDLFKK